MTIKESIEAIVEFFMKPDMKVINDRLKVMDATAITLCMENHIPILVFGLLEKDSIYRVVSGENLGTIIDK